MFKIALKKELVLPFNAAASSIGITELRLLFLWYIRFKCFGLDEKEVKEVISKSIKRD